jgi:hypothetical protein
MRQAVKKGHAHEGKLFRWQACHRHAQHIVARQGIQHPVGVDAALVGDVERETVGIDEVDAVATQLTARVIRELRADVLGVVEAESRPALAQ